MVFLLEDLARISPPLSEAAHWSPPDTCADPPTAGATVGPHCSHGRGGRPRAQRFPRGGGKPSARSQPGAPLDTASARVWGGGGGARRRPPAGGGGISISDAKSGVTVRPPPGAAIAAAALPPLLVPRPPAGTAARGTVARGGDDDTPPDAAALDAVRAEVDAQAEVLRTGVRAASASVAAAERRQRRTAAAIGEVVRLAAVEGAAKDAAVGALGGAPDAAAAAVCICG